MLKATKFVSNFKFKSIKCPTISNMRMSNKSLETTDKQPKPEENNNDFTSMSRRTHNPNYLERKALVWTGRFKTEADIPNSVPVETIELARNKARIKVANYMMLFTVISCFFVALSGKKAAERGESVAKMNLDWHREINDKK